MVDNFKRSTSAGVIYVLPKCDFFSQGDRGRVTHALGVAEGLQENSHRVTIVSGAGLKKYRNQLSKTPHMIEVIAHKLGWSWKLLKNIQTQLQPEDTEVLIVRYAVSKFLFCLILNFLAHRNGIRTVIEVNSYAIHDRRLPRFLRLLWWPFELFLTSRFDVVYVVSEALQKTLKNHKCKSDIVVVPNGAFVPDIEVKTCGTQRLDSSRLVYFGTLHKYYDFSIVIEGFRKLKDNQPSCELHFFGDGNAAADLKTLATGIDGIYFHGRYKREEIGALLCSARDILVLPPKQAWDIELSGGLSTKIFEYMSLPAPMVAPDMGELAEVISDGFSAKVYQPDDVEGFVSACLDLAPTADLRETINYNATKDFLERFTWKARMKTLMNRVLIR